MNKRIAPSVTLAVGFLALSGSLASAPAAGQLAIDTLDAPVAIDFTGYEGAGLSPTPAPGQLDSTVFSIAGFSEGDLPFGATAEAGDFARGTTGGGVSTGGVYAFDLGEGDMALGFQPTTSDYTPGSLTLCLRNDTAVPLEKIILTYDVVVFNDQGRGSSFHLSFAGDELGPYDDVPGAAFVSPADADSTPGYVLTARAAELLPTPVPPGGLLYLRWTSDDDGGTGSRDEIGIDNVVIVAQTLAPDPNLIFADGFESADLSHWSGYAP